MSAHPPQVRYPIVTAAQIIGAHSYDSVRGARRGKHTRLASSTDSQDLESQKHTVEKYLDKLDTKPEKVTVFEDIGSGAYPVTA